MGEWFHTVYYYFLELDPVVTLLFICFCGYCDYYDYNFVENERGRKDVNWFLVCKTGGTDKFRGSHETRDDQY